MTVQNFMKIVWTFFEKFEIFMKRSGEKKRHDWISSRKFFPTLKNLFITGNSSSRMGGCFLEGESADFLYPSSNISPKHG